MPTIELKITEIFEWFGLDTPPLGKNITCPNPHHNDTTPSFRIHPNNETCYCFGCGIKGAWGLLTALAGSYEKAKEIVQQHKLSIAVIKEREKKPIKSKDKLEEAIEKAAYDLLADPHLKRIREILDKRGIDIETADKYHLGYAKPGFILPQFQNRILIPVYAKNGMLVNLIGRATKQGQEPKYIKLNKEEGMGLPLGYENLEQNRPIWLVEGEFDALSLFKKDKKAIAIGGVNGYSNFWKIIPIGKKFIIAMDNDIAGEEAIYPLILKLIPKTLQIAIAKLPIEGDINDCLVKNQIKNIRTIGLETYLQNLTEKQQIKILKKIATYYPHSIINKFKKTLNIKFNIEVSEQEIINEFKNQHTFMYSETHGIFEFTDFWKRSSPSQLRQKIQKQFPYLPQTKIELISRRYQDQINIGETPLNDLPFGTIACKNGLLNILTGEIRSYKPSDYITTCLKTIYNPEATMPKTKKFIEEITNENKGREEALQYVGGQIILMNPSYIQRFHCFIGDGDNGKSRCIEMFTEVIGNKLSAPFNFSQLQKEFGVAAFSEIIYAICADAEVDLEKTNILKQITGGDRINGRFPYGRKEFYFVPKVTIVFSTNSLPKFRNIDTAMQKRLNVIEFKRVFANPGSPTAIKARMKHIKVSPPNPRLNEIFKKEAQGILNWMIEGAKKIVENKGRIPKSPDTKEALTKIIYQSSSAWEWWIDDGYKHFYQGPKIKSKVTKKEIWKRYKDWAIETGNKITTRKWLISKLLENNFLVEIEDSYFDYIIPQIKKIKAMKQEMKEIKNGTI